MAPKDLLNIFFITWRDFSLSSLSSFKSDWYELLSLLATVACNLPRSSCTIWNFAYRNRVWKEKKERYNSIFCELQTKMLRKVWSTPAQNDNFPHFVYVFHSASVMKDKNDYLHAQKNWITLNIDLLSERLQPAWDIQITALRNKIK